MKKAKNKVYCFVGDMTSETGIMSESLKYAENHKLPIHFVVEDNSLSVCTDTKKVWGLKKLSNQNKKINTLRIINTNLNILTQVLVKGFNFNEIF